MRGVRLKFGGDSGASGQPRATEINVYVEAFHVSLSDFHGLNLP